MNAFFCFFIVLGILVFIHELGHFLAAKLCGVRVISFSLGFGPVLFKKDFWDTEFRISLIPFGGYVQMFGEDPSIELVSDGEKKRSFNSQKSWKKIIIVSMGVIFNFVFAIIIFSGLNMISEKQIVYPVVGGFTENSPAQKAGIQIGDKIIRINGQKISDWRDIVMELHGAKDGVMVQVERYSKVFDLYVYTESVKIKVLSGEELDSKGIGIYFKHGLVHLGFFDSLKSGVKEVYGIGRSNAVGIKKMIVGTISAKENIGGPIAIAKMASESAKSGWEDFFWFLGFVSVCLGFINLVPIPVLDGGHIAAYGIEWITGRSINKTVWMVLNKIGYYLLIALMIFVVINDCIKYF